MMARIKASGKARFGISFPAGRCVMLKGLHAIEGGRDASGRPPPALTCMHPCGPLTRSAPIQGLTGKPVWNRCCSRNCDRRARPDATGVFQRREGGHQASTREPGDLPTWSNPDRRGRESSWEN